MHSIHLDTIIYLSLVTLQNSVSFVPIYALMLYLLVIYNIFNAMYTQALRSLKGFISYSAN